jgi:hypothetical protein
MINSESFNKIIDDSMLLFLDDFEAEAGRLPNEIEKNIWMRGFIDACESITLAVKER